MLRKTVIALMATAAVAMLVPDVASAQRGFGGGRGGGFAGGAAMGGGAASVVRQSAEAAASVVRQSAEVAASVVRQSAEVAASVVRQSAEVAASAQPRWQEAGVSLQSRGAVASARPPLAVFVRPLLVQPGRSARQPLAGPAPSTVVQLSGRVGSQASGPVDFTMAAFTMASAARSSSVPRSAWVCTEPIPTTTTTIIRPTPMTTIMRTAATS